MMDLESRVLVAETELAWLRVRVAELEKDPGLTDTTWLVKWISELDRRLYNLDDKVDHERKNGLITAQQATDTEAEVAKVQERLEFLSEEVADLKSPTVTTTGAACRPMSASDASLLEQLEEFFDQDRKDSVDTEWEWGWKSCREHVEELVQAWKELDKC